MPTPLFTLKSEGKYPRRGNHASVVYDDKGSLEIWNMGGWDGSSVYDDVWGSRNGVDWSLKSGRIQKVYGHTAVLFDNRQPPGETIWLLGGHDGQTGGTRLVQKFNGDTWDFSTGEFTPGRYYHTSVVHQPLGAPNPLMWIIAGNDGSKNEALNDVWYTTDGSGWQLRTQDKFPKRGQHASVVFDRGDGPKIYIYGGYDPATGTVLKDCWYSENGLDWIQGADLPFGGRYGMTVVVDPSRRLWLIGGTDDSRVYNDLWMSNDGENWTQMTDLVTDKDRFGHTSVVFTGDKPDQVWAISGFNKLPRSTALDDVWSSP